MAPVKGLEGKKNKEGVGCHYHQAQNAKTSKG